LIGSRRLFLCADLTMPLSGWAEAPGCVSHRRCARWRGPFAGAFARRLPPCGSAYSLPTLHKRIASEHVSGPATSTAQLRFRPVRPAPSAWHAMPGQRPSHAPRPVKAVLSRFPQHSAPTWHVWSTVRRGQRWIRVFRGYRGAPSSNAFPKIFNRRMEVGCHPVW
jgi:hypothetical protein